MGARNGAPRCRVRAQASSRRPCRSSMTSTADVSPRCTARSRHTVRIQLSHVGSDHDEERLVVADRRGQQPAVGVLDREIERLHHRMVHAIVPVDPPCGRLVAVIDTEVPRDDGPHITPVRKHLPFSRCSACVQRLSTAFMLWLTNRTVRPSAGDLAHLAQALLLELPRRRPPAPRRRAGSPAPGGRPPRTPAARTCRCE